MSKRLRRILARAIAPFLATLFAAAPLFAAEMRGWQGMRVMQQDGNPGRFLVADVDRDGRDEIIVINTRHSRLDLYRWMPPGARRDPLPADPERPNELPLAPEWTRTELALEDLPVDVELIDLDGDGTREWLVMSSSANKLISYCLTDQDKLSKITSWDLQPGTPAGRELLLVRRMKKGGFEALASYEQGIQVVPLAAGARATWLLPREFRTRNAFGLIDFDGDGDEDLIEWSPVAKQTVRWYPCTDGALQPAQVLYDKPVQRFQVLPVSGKQAEVLLLAGTQEQALQRFALGRGDESAVGRQQAVPFAGGGKATPWTGMVLGDNRCLVAVDPAQPRLRAQALGQEGWLAEDYFPSISGVRALAAPFGAPGTLLLWAKDAADLHVSDWEAGRLTYPRTLPRSESVADRKILALDAVGTTVWWAQKVADDVDLYVWDQRDKEAASTRFAGAGAKAERVQWCGGTRIMVQQTYSQGAKLAAIDGDKTTIAEPPHLAKIDFNEYRLFDRGGERALARLTDGVVQWLNDNLEPVDQVMLPDGQRIAGFVPLPDRAAYALEQGGAFLHKMKADDAGILRVTESYKLSGGTAITRDEALGLIVSDTERLTQLSHGRRWELRLLDSIDSRVGRPSGVKESTIHRVFVSELTGDDQEDVLICDDRRHQLSLLARTEEGLKSVFTWPVFEDLRYPYGDEASELVPEPRAVAGLDADGDGQRDMAMLCHDRVLVYLAKDGSP
ncbi:MAG: VCBS repeat-containing protein [Planctomycetes bacterium]|nr:VCBS repeat-containing protein [Planctomycetota bacterium]